MSISLCSILKVKVTFPVQKVSRSQSTRDGESGEPREEGWGGFEGEPHPVMPGEHL